MAEIVNLRRVKKQRARAEAAEQAAANRAKFGRSKAEKQADTLEARRAAKVLDGVKREDDPR